MPDVHEVLDRMARLRRPGPRRGDWTGHTGKPIRNVVNIGIGGSDLGPVMAYEALRHYSAARPDLPLRLERRRHRLRREDPRPRPGETLFIVSSKTFTTLETMTNAHTARDWSLPRCGDEAAVAKHFVAVSTNAEEVAEFGIDTANMFGFWDWVGGRYSMESAIGLSTMIAIGPDSFSELLAGFHAIDEHFRTAPLEREPARAAWACSTVWYVDFFGAADRGRAALRPVPAALPGLPAAADDGVQRQVGDARRRGASTTRPAPVYWGEPGTNGQHSFYQLIHQGTLLIPCDFIAFATSLNPLGDHHDFLMANVFAQARGARVRQDRGGGAGRGRRRRLVPHKVFEGNRPSYTFLVERLTPASLGELVALYEHSVFTQGADLGHRLVRPVGRRAGQGARAADRPASCSGRRARARGTTARRTR